MISFDDCIHACNTVNDVKSRLGNAVSYDGACILASAMIIADAIKGGYTIECHGAQDNIANSFREIARRLKGND